MLSIIGPSGCGKSTLLNIIGQVILPTKGEIYLDGVRMLQRDSDRTRARNLVFGYLFQDFALVESDTGVQNIQLPLRYARIRVSRSDMNQKVRSALIDVGAESFAHRQVKLMSGGQRQRIALARALVNDPKIILADEPTGALDTANGERVFSLLQDQARNGRLVIVVTHNLDLALACDRVIALRDGVQIDPSEALPKRAMRR